MYRPTLAIDAIGLDSPEAINVAMANMGDVLMALVSINRRYIRLDREKVALGYQEQIPLLYDSGVRYDRLEPIGETCGDDDFQDCVTVLEHPEHPMLGDCFPRGTLLLRDDYELIPIEEIRIGDRIWGRDVWTTVEASVYKGLLSVDGLVMNNGSVAKLTGDHHVYVRRCPRHVSCDCVDRPVGRIRLREVVDGDLLVQPVEHPFGPAMDPRHDRQRDEEQALRAVRTHRDLAKVPCYDIRTSDHYVYLPEHDVTVSNCDDLACWRVAELNERYGIAAVPYIRLHADRVHDVISGQMMPRHLYHIMVRFPEGLDSYPSTVFVDPDAGAYLEDPSAVLGMTGSG